MRTAQSNNWIRVTRSEPCPICEKPDYCCRTVDGGTVLCMRRKSDRPSRGKSGGWLHSLGDDAPKPLVRKTEPQKRPVIDWEKKSAEMFNHRQAAANRQRLSVELGIPETALELLGVGWGFDREGFWSFPERSPNGKVSGIVRRYNDGRKKTIRWSRHGLYFERDWEFRKGPVLLPEGGSDTAALIGMGLSAVGRPSNVGGVTLLAAILRGCKKPIVVLAERDNKPGKCDVCEGCALCWPGLYGAKRTAEQLSEALRKRVLVRFPSDEKKDVRDWLGRREVTEAIGGAFLNGLVMG